MTDQTEPRHERVAIITGTSSGFGMLTAVELARKGIRVVATMRDPARAGELTAHAERAGVQERIDVRALDVTDQPAVERVVRETVETYGRVDILVNNAGFALGGFAEDVPMEQWRRQMETNFFGLVAMTKAVIPVMRRQGSGCIVNVGSISGRIGFPGFGPYAASKFAVEGLSECLRLELAPCGIRVVLVEPGAFRTAIWDKGLSHIPDPAQSPYAARMRAVLKYARDAAATAPDPRRVAERIAALVDHPSPRLRYPVGRGSRLTLLGKALVPWKWFERIVVSATRGDSSSNADA
jgi:NAD(P)-dependent dehydrogenase (short-subunit alcohol dehydrogenase family)